MREAAVRNGTYPPATGRPFTATEDALLGTMTDKALAARLDRHPKSIHERRRVLGIPSFPTRRPMSP
jgi:hypothetical protein